MANKKTKSSSDGSSVVRWGRFEGQLRHPEPPADPFRGVTLQARFISPSGRITDWWGFYDGGSTWRYRWMAEETGLWRYRVWFSDGAAADEGSFSVVEGDLPGPLGPAPENPIWFGYRTGQPVFVRSFHVGDRFLARNWPDKQRRAFLDYFQEQGYNLLSVASCFVNRDAPGRGREWKTPNLWPFDPAEYRLLEKHLDELERRRIHLFPFAGFFGQDGHHPTDPAEQEAYLRYVLARIGPYWNIIFNVAGPEPNLKARFWMEIEDVDRLGKLIRKLDPFRHALTVHNETGDDEFKHADWTDYGTLQGPKTVSRIKLSKGLRKNHHWAKPLYAQETLWSGNINHLKDGSGEPRAEYLDEDIRKNAYVLAFCASAVCYADNAGDSSTGFSGTMNFDERRQDFHDILKSVWDWMETQDVLRLSPAYKLADHGWCLADGTQRYRFYIEESKPLKVSLPDLGSYEARWLDAQKPQGKAKPAKADKDGTFTPPSGGDDWLLLLDRKAGAPAKPTKGKAAKPAKEAKSAEAKASKKGGKKGK